MKRSNRKSHPGRLSDLICQQSDKAAAVELAKINPPGASSDHESRGCGRNGLTKAIVRVNLVPNPRHSAAPMPDL
jgi:hypothetical protein